MSAVSFYRNFGLAILAVTLPVLASTQIVNRSLPITLDADHSVLDRNKNQSIFTGLRITQGAFGIEADFGTTNFGSERDFQNSIWEFKGNVKIDLDGAKIDCDSATLTFINHALASAEVRGAPAHFEQQRPDNRGKTEARAKSFNYDIARGEIRFEGDARVAELGNAVSGSLLVYDIAQRKIVFDGDDETGERVRITINPPPEMQQDDLIDKNVSPTGNPDQ